MIQQFKQIKQTVEMAQNPQLALNQMLMTNPQLAQAFNLIRSMGGDGKTTYYNYAHQIGIDPDQFLNEIKKSLS